ncbi:MAG: hypothetical protein Q9218_003310 [Villophora microphyllina]
MAVGFGFSVGDIIASYKLAQEICDNCFTRSQAADVKYLRFRQEINSLGESLRRLETILINAGAQRPRRPWHTDTDQFGEVFQVLPEVTGDFKKTLKDCDRLLKDHARLQYGGASIADNMAWWTTTERDVNSLRERVTFHITKVSFIAKPFETQLLLEIRRDLQLLRNDVAELRGIMTNGLSQPRDSTNASYLQSVHIPHELAYRFTAALETNRPLSLMESSKWPVKEGFNALVFHFAKSTVEFSSNRRLGQNVPDPSQYLNLLKSVWAMRQVKDSPHFRSTGTDSLWADYMRELEMDIKGQFHRFDAQQLVRPPVSDLLQLPDEYYTVWVDEDPPLHSLDIVEQRPLEEKVVELALPESYGNRQTSLTVFRKSEYEFRLVKMTKMADNPFYHSEEGSNVNMNSTRLIPAYATPGAESSDAHNLALCNDRGQHEEWHLLKNLDDVKALQRALTGYRVHHDMSGFSWCINGSKEPEDSGTGYLQMWQLKPLSKIEPEKGPKPLDRATTNLSQLTAVNDVYAQPGARSPEQRRSSGMTPNRTLSSSWANSFPRVLESCFQSPGRKLGREIFRNLTHDVVVRHKHDSNRPVEQDVFINPKSCACHKPKRNCTRVVLESKAKPFVLHRFSADKEKAQGLFSWDLAMFRYPRRPEYKNINVVEKMKYLDLDFGDVKVKEEFISELRQLENVRNTDYNNYVKHLNEKKARAMS